MRCGDQNRKILLTGALAAFAVLADPAALRGEGEVAAPFLATNEQAIARLGAASDLDIDQPLDVFAAVLSSLGEEARVLPTENYYFFEFFVGGSLYAGNIRLDAADRDEGIVHFTYFPRGPGGAPGEVRHTAFARGDGVKVTRADALTYVIAHGGTAVVFRLNDLRAVRPGEDVLRDGEEFIGPVFDESGVGFFLLWNSKLEIFLYVLNEDMTRDRFAVPAWSTQIAIGERTGFALYSDRYQARHILVGVSRREARLNTLLDGPFDQMPDNFIAGDALRDALIARRPGLAGRIDRFGNFADLAGRAIVVPYLLYEESRELALFDQCAARAATADAYYRCFDHGGDGPETGAGDGN